MFKITNINKTFNHGTINENHVLKDVSLTLEDGDFVTVIGGNGAGKSTLQNIISGSIFPDSGNIILDDIDITFMPEHKRAKYLGRVFQDPLQGTAGDMWLSENLAIANRRGKKRGLGWGIKKEEKQTYSNILAPLNLGLENRLNSKVKRLSGGQRQALTLLMATLQNPALLLLDEHTAALDPKTAEIVLSLTEKLVSERNLTTLMITHNMKDAIRYGNRLIMLFAGEIVLDIKGQEKKDLTVTELINLFSQAVPSGIVDDNLILNS